MQSAKKLIFIAAALVAILILPTSASASASGGFAAAFYPSAIHAAPGTMTIEGPGFVTTCTAPTLDGTLEGPAHSLSMSETAVGPCTGGGSVEMKGCKLILRPGSQTADIGPTGCGPINFRVSPCGNAVIPAQNGLATTYAGTEKYGLQEVTEIKLAGKATTGGTACVKSGTTVTITASWTVTSTSGKETNRLYAGKEFTPVGIHLSHETPAQLESLVYPVKVQTLAGVTVNPFEYAPFKEVLSCKTATLTSSEFTKKATASLSLSGTYGGCSSGFGTTTIEMNSCSYKLPELEYTAEGKFTVKGGASIACSKEGDAIKLVMPAGCTFKIPGQSLESSLNGDDTLGALSGAFLHLSSSHLQYTSSFTCQLAGYPKSGEDAAMNQDLGLIGSLP